MSRLFTSEQKQPNNWDGVFVRFGSVGEQPIARQSSIFGGQGTFSCAPNCKWVTDCCPCFSLCENPMIGVPCTPIDEISSRLPELITRPVLAGNCKKRLACGVSKLIFVVALETSLVLKHTYFQSETKHSIPASAFNDSRRGALPPHSELSEDTHEHTKQRSASVTLPMLMWPSKSRPIPTSISSYSECPARYRVREK